MQSISGASPPAAPCSPLPGPGVMVFGRAVCEWVVQVTTALIWEGSCHGNPSLSFLATGEHLFSIARLRWETLAGGRSLIKLEKKKRQRENAPARRCLVLLIPAACRDVPTPGGVTSLGALPGVPAAHLGRFGVLLAARQMARQ